MRLDSIPSSYPCQLNLSGSKPLRHGVAGAPLDRFFTPLCEGALFGENPKGTHPFSGLPTDKPKAKQPFGRPMLAYFSWPNADHALVPDPLFATKETGSHS